MNNLSSYECQGFHDTHAERVALLCRCRMLRQAFVAWRIANAALAHQQRRVAELMLAARAQRGQRAAFLAWRQHMAHMWTARNTAALKGLARQKQMQAALLTWALRSWRQYTRERAGRKLEEASLTRSAPYTVLCSHSIRQTCSEGQTPWCGGQRYLKHCMTDCYVI